MSLTRQRPASSGHPASSTFSRPCPKHSKETIKFYCNDHKVLLCNVCVVLEHTVTTCSVNYLPDVSEKTVNSQEVTDTLETIAAQVQKCKEITENLKKLNAVSHDSLKTVVEEINKYRLKINDQLDKLEQATKDAIEAVTVKIDKQLKAAEEASEGILTSLKASADSIKLFNSLKQADRLFMELKSAGNQVKENEQRISNLSSRDVKQYHFKPHRTILTFLESETSIGQLSEKVTTISNHSSPPASRQGGIYVKMTNNPNACWVTGMVLLSPSKLAIADHENQSIKLVDTGNQSILHQLELNNWVWDITMVTTDQLAVTLPDQQVIQFASVSQNKLRETNCLNVDGQCYGINCFEEKLLVSFNYPGKLEIINLTGDLLMSVSTDNNFEEIFNEPEYVVANKTAIYVSDCKRQAVLMLNWKGQVLNKYRSTGAPKGLSLLQDGSLLIAYSHEDICSIQTVNSDCTKGKEVLKNLRQPHSICWCETTGIMYVSFHGAGERNDNCIQIYKI